MYVTTFLGSSVPLCWRRTGKGPRGPSLLELKVRPLIHSDREVGMRPGRGECVLGYPSTDASPRPFRGSGRGRDAALVCSAGPGAFPAQRDEALSGSAWGL